MIRTTTIFALSLFVISAASADMAGVWQGNATLTEGKDSAPFAWDLVIDYDGGANPTVRIWDNPHYIPTNATYVLKGTEIWTQYRKVGDYTDVLMSLSLVDEIFQNAYALTATLNADGTLNYTDTFTYYDGMVEGLSAMNLVRDTKADVKSLKRSSGPSLRQL